MRLIFRIVLACIISPFCGFSQSGTINFWNAVNLANKESKLINNGSSTPSLKHNVIEAGVFIGIQSNLSGNMNTVVVQSSTFAPGTSTTSGLFGSMVKLLGGPYTILYKEINVKNESFGSLGVFFGHAINKKMQVSIRINTASGRLKGETKASVISLARPSTKPDTVSFAFEGSTNNLDLQIAARYYTGGNNLKPFVTGNILLGYTQNKVKNISYKGNSLSYEQKESLFIGGAGIGIGLRYNIGEHIFVEIGDNINLLTGSKGVSGIKNGIGITAGARL
jgi:hypothetical protein